MEWHYLIFSAFLNLFSTIDGSEEKSDNSSTEESGILNNSFCMGIHLSYMDYVYIGNETERTIVEKIITIVNIDYEKI